MPFKSGLALKHKLTLGFTGLLALLLVLGTLSLLLLKQYSSTLETIFKENYNSVVYAQKMKEIVDTFDDQLEQGGGSADAAALAAEQFDEILSQEYKNLTVAGEKEIADRLHDEWTTYKGSYQKWFASQTERRSELYQTELRPRSIKIKDLAQDIIDLNLTNILSVDGRVKLSANAAQRTMILLLLAGVALAALLIIFATRSILRPLQLITESAREIQKGNLDLTLPISAQDEIGQLAEAFNGMTSRLREFRRSNRAQLFRVQKTTQLALNSFPEAVAIIGLDGKVELANEHAIRRFQLLPGSDLVKHEQKILWSMFRETFASLSPVVSKGYEKAIQLFIDGEEYFFLAQTVPIIDESKTLNGVTLVLIDVTNLRKIDESKSGMLSVVSHELKTPLTSIRMATHLLLDDRMGPLTNKQTELLMTAREDADRLHRIIDNLLDMSRIESGSQQLDLSENTPERIVRVSSQVFFNSARDQGVRVVIDVSDQLPKVWVDPNRISHVFGNLISNALKHTTPGGTITLSAKAEPDSSSVLFSVHNSGINIPEESLGKVFDKFFRLPHSEEMEGVGLGLAIARDIVNAHGGRIWAEKLAPDSGAQFCFTLKVSDQSLNHDERTIS